MTWGLQQRDFPILTPGQMNPFHQALQQGLETYRGITQAQYEPLKLQADSMSKLAYAQLMGPQYVAKLLGNKDIAANIPDPVKNQALGQIVNVGTGLTSGTPNAQAAAPQQSGTLMDSLHNWYQGMFGQSTANSNQPVTSGTNAPRAGSNEGYRYDAKGNNVVMSPSEISQVGNQDGQVNLGDGVIGTVVPEVGTEVPPPAQSQDTSWAGKIGQQKKTEAKAEEEGKLESKQWDEQIKETRKNLIPSEQLHQNYETLRTEYKKLGNFEKGPVFGHGPAVSNAAQKFDNVAQDAVNNAARAQQMGHITNVDFQLYGKTKANRTLGEDAFKEIANKNDALALRQKQVMKFYSEAKKRGYTVDEANTMLGEFVENHPIFNPTTGNLIKENYTMSPFDAKRSRPQRQTASSAANSTSPGKVRTYNPATGRIE